MARTGNSRSQSLRPAVKWAAITLLPVLLASAAACFGNESATSNQAQRSVAAEAAAQQGAFCKAINPFYWEIGNATGVLASGSTGDGSIRRDTAFAIASASKFVFAAYVIQRLRGDLDTQTQKSLKMISGYTSLAPLSCIYTPTVQDCLNKGSNSLYSTANDNKFFYNGGHFQKWAVDHGLGPMTRDQVVKEYQRQLGTDFDFSFGAFQMAGGMRTSAQNYAVFLQKILNGQLLISRYLGANPTCTLPARCAQSVRSPIRAAWHYSYGHWVEDDPEEGDGSFSSPGAFGFYPWIDASKTYYGVISRRHRGAMDDGDIGAGAASARCGRLIRKAYFAPAGAKP